MSNPKSLQSSISRRRFMQSLVAASGTIALAGVPFVNRAAAQTSTKTITFASSAAIDSPQTLVLQGLFQEFEALHSDVKIEFQPIPYDNFMQTLTTRVIGGQAPDTALLLDRWAPAMIAQNALLPLNDYLPDNHGDAFNSVAWNFGVVDGQQHALPLFTNVQANIYNVDQFEAAGIEVPTSVADAWSFAELMAVTEQVKATNGTDFGLIHWMHSTPARLSIYLVGMGGSILTSDLSASALNSPEAIELLTLIQETFTSGLSPLDNWTQGGRDTMFPLWASGGASTLIASGNFQVLPADEQVGNQFRWGFHLMPTTLGTPILLAGFNQTRYPDEVAEFLMFMTQPEIMARYAVETVSIPTRTDIPAEALAYPTGNEPNQIPVLLEQLNAASPQIQAEMRHPAWSEIDLMLRARLEALALGQATPQQVAEEGAEEIEQLLARYDQ